MYQFFSRFTPGVCRFQPTCSAYAVEALQKYGLWKGIFFSAKRLLRCHPWHPGGFDPLE